LKTLAWRVSCPYYRAEYGDRQRLLHLAQTLETKAYRRLCCDTVIEIVSNCTHPVLPESVPSCFILLAEAVVPLPSADTEKLSRLEQNSALVLWTDSFHRVDPISGSQQLITLALLSITCRTILTARAVFFQLQS
jgi:hypothetical protein